jgi:hypothetical protein
MIGVSIGNRGAFLKLVTDAAALDADIRGALRVMARDYNRIVADELRRPKSGKQYGVRTGRARYKIVRKRVTLFGGIQRTVSRRQQMKSRNVRSWTASAPDEAPAVFTGNLLRGLRIAFPSREKGYGARIFSRRGIAAHRHLLEFGTTNRVQKRQNGKTVNRRVGRVAPRPIWSPMQKRALADLERRVLRVIESSAAFRGVG